MKRAWVVTALLLTVPLYAQAAPIPQGCSIDSIVGDWGFGADGKSLVASAVPDPVTRHMSGRVLPGAFVGRFTVRPDGTFGGYYWFNMGGGMISGLKPIEFGGPVTVNPNCTGEWSYQVSDPHGEPVDVVERFAIVDTRQEIRSISWTASIPTFTWTLVARRIPSACTQPMARGNYAMQCRGHGVMTGLPRPDSALLSEVGLFRFVVGREGHAAGTRLEKIGPVNLEGEFWGHFFVDPDCSTGVDFLVPKLGNVRAVGMMVDGTARGYGMPMILETAPEEDAVAGGEVIPPFQAVYCELVRIKPASSN